MPEFALELIHNTALIVALVAVQQYIMRRQPQPRMPQNLVLGVLYGGVGIIAMMSPIIFVPGLIFDARSVILSAVGMFCGPVAAAIAAGMCAAYRISLGGVGVIPGVLIIVGSAAIGSIMYVLRRHNLWADRPISLWAFGVTVQLYVLVCLLVLSRELAMRVIQQIGLFTLLLFPLATLLLAELLLEQERWTRTQDALSSNEERLRLALETTNQGLYDLDLKAGQAVVTPEYAMMLGYDPETFHETIQAWIERLHPDDKDRVVGIFRDYVAGHSPTYRVEFRQRTAQGGWKWILSLGRIVERDEDGNPVRMLGTHTDISDRKAADSELEEHREHLEELVAARTSELAEANVKLRKASQAKSDFLASVSHELRTPLNSIIGFSGVLLQGLSGELEKGQRQQVETINGSGKHLLALIDDILDLSKVEAGKAELQVESFGPADLASNVATMMRPLAEDKGLELRTSFDLDTRPLVSDAGKVKQILLNLMGNAVKFTDSGCVEIEVRRDPGGGATFSISDTGPGISESDLPRVFEVFTQIAPAHGTKPSGTGLGLALSREFARVLGGEISAESELGKGSTFRLWVPGRD